MRLIVIGMLAGAAVLSVAFVHAQKPAAPVMDVYKSPTCGCCSVWVEHVRKAGFTVRVTDMPNAELDQVKTKHRVPAQSQSCHTGVIGGYVVEGHVPAAEVTRLLKERPAVAGIAVGGMPMGSPGMEVPGVKPQQYNVVSFDKAGALKVFATYNK